ncbi:MAG TPA: sugar phosphate isomerase/epimerase family protein [Lacunisphaera sp.]|nr:sugar phosphate isomerase/epimerase family protein [Lacunisphaera sp.]
MIFPSSFTIISDEVSQELPALAAFVREFGLPGIELRSMFGRAFKDLTSADIAEIRRVAQGEGWRIYGCASPVFKCGIDDPAALAQHRDEFQRSVAVARELGCDLVRVFTFLRGSAADNPGMLRRAAEHLAGLRALAAGSGVRIGVENEHSCTVALGSELREFMTLLPSPEIGIVWDPCNALYVPGSPAEVTADYAAFAARVFHVHIKDARRRVPAPGELPAVAEPVGQGEVGWKRHLQEILNTGYRGMFSLETHWRHEQLAEADLHLPAGYAFSRGGAEASRVCFDALRGLLPEGR